MLSSIFNCVNILHTAGQVASLLALLLQIEHGYSFLELIENAFGTLFLCPMALLPLENVICLDVSEALF